jgi:NAD(P)-dependent dehydrogenase (short-subunit alcohol dehydrogenase family)
VHDAGGAFGAGGEGGLAAALQGAWNAVASAAARSMIPAGSSGKVVLIAPRSGAGRYADPARAGLENLARTLSIEWARYGITVTAIAPGRTTREEDVALLVAFLLSGAGDYYSGCRFELDAVERRART